MVPFHEVGLRDESRADVNRVGAVAKVDVDGLHLASDSCKDEKTDASRVTRCAEEDGTKARKKTRGEQR